MQMPNHPLAPGEETGYPFRHAKCPISRGKQPIHAQLTGNHQVQISLNPIEDLAEHVKL